MVELMIDNLFGIKIPDRAISSTRINPIGVFFRHSKTLFPSYKILSNPPVKRRHSDTACDVDNRGRSTQKLSLLDLGAGEMRKHRGLQILLGIH